MKERKYKDDYAIHTTFSDKGREQQNVVYQGEYFRFEGGTQEKYRSLRWSLGCAGIFFLSYLIYMKLNTPSSRCIYVMPIAAVALIVFIYWLMGLAALFRCPDQMTRLQKENSMGRILRSSIGCALLLGMACVGDIIYMLVSLKEQVSAEFPGFALLCCAAIAALSSFLRIREVYGKISVCSKKGEESSP